MSKHLFDILGNIFVAYAHDTKVALLQIFGAGCVVFSLLVVDVAIDFDDEASIVAVEVSDETTDGVLSPDFQSTQLAVAYAMPE